jgi:hypothetical protein
MNVEIGTEAAHFSEEKENINGICVAVQKGNCSLENLLLEKLLNAYTIETIFLLRTYNAWVQ